MGARRTAFVKAGGLSILLVMSGACDAVTSPTDLSANLILPTKTSVLLGDSPILVGAGDIAACSYDGDEATAALLDLIPGTVFTLGDNVQVNGTAEEYALCYEPSWGRHKHRTKPSAGNHDYDIPGAAAYFKYFGAAAGEPGKGYYSYDLGTWHIVVINSNIDVHEGSPQVQWLRADLEANRAHCTLAYWHHPRFSSGLMGNNPSMNAIWQVLFEAGADVVLSGHDHLYERFSPQTPDGVPDATRGIRQFTVGTGGAPQPGLGVAAANSEVVNHDTYGVLVLALQPTSYQWEFVPVSGRSFWDHGRGACH